MGNRKSGTDGCFPQNAEAQSCFSCFCFPLRTFASFALNALVAGLCFFAALGTQIPPHAIPSSFILCLRCNLDPSFARLKVSLRRNKPSERVVAFILALLCVP